MLKMNDLHRDPFDDVLEFDDEQTTNDYVSDLDTENDFDLVDYINECYDLDNNYIDINSLDVSKMKKRLL